MRGSRHSNALPFHLLPLQCTISSLCSPFLFLEGWVLLPLHSYHAVSVGGGWGYFFLSVEFVQG